jgi:hypothetical protein
MRYNERIGFTSAPAMKQRFIVLAVTAALIAVGVFAFVSTSRTDAQVVSCTYYASPTGSGSGSFSSPLSLAAAFSDSSPVGPGETLCLRGGTYSGKITARLHGTASQPIIVRNYNGERATIDGGNTEMSPVFTVDSTYTWFWGLEVMSSETDKISDVSVANNSWPPDILFGEGVMMAQNGSGGTGCKFINMVVHDTRQGFSLWQSAVGAEVYGSIMYDNGWKGPDRMHGHNIYMQNQNGTQRIEDNFILRAYSHNIQAYGTEAAYTNNMQFIGNTSVNGGERNFLFGSGNVGLNPVFHENVLYNDGAATGESIFLMSYWPTVGTLNAVVTDNYIIGGKLTFDNNVGMTFTGNTLYNDATIDGGDIPSMSGNTVLFSKPTTNTIVVRPNKYESGRANITILNWTGQNTVAVNVSNVLSNNDTFEVRDAQNFYGTPVLTGTYTGGTISIPMTTGTLPPRIGNDPRATAHTQRDLGTFVLIRTSGSSGGASDTSAPSSVTLSLTPTQTTGSFTISWTAATDPESGIARYELWRAPDASGSPGTWAKVSDLSNTTLSTTDTPSVGTYWYGIHAVNTVGLWSSEAAAQRGVRTSPSSQAASLYVDGRLSADCVGAYSLTTRSCTGSDGTAYKDIPTAISAMKVGDTLKIRQGLYTYNSGMVVGFSGPMTTIESYNDESVEIHKNTVASAVFSLSPSAANVTFKGITFTGTQYRLVSGWTNYSGNIWQAAVPEVTTGVRFNLNKGTEADSIAALTSPYQWIFSGNTLYVYSVGNPSTTYTSPGVALTDDFSAIAIGNPSSGNTSLIVIDDCEFRDFSHVAIKGSFKWWIKNSIFENTGTDELDHHIYAGTHLSAGNEAIIEHNYFGHVSGAAVHLYVSPSYYIVRYNVFNGDSATGKSFYSVLLSGDHNKVYGNTITASRYGVMFFRTEAHNDDVTNNIFYKNDWDIAIDQTPYANTLAYNYLGSSNKCSGCYDQTASGGENYLAMLDTPTNIKDTANPFTSASPKVWSDFKLSGQARVINAGTNLGTGNDAAFDPGAASWPASTVSQNSYGNWEMGAFVYTAAQ